MAIQIGDGAGVDALVSTLAAASAACGADVEVDGAGELKFVASATLRSAAGSKWSMRTEHLILLERRQ